MWRRLIRIFTLGAIAGIFVIPFNPVNRRILKLALLALSLTGIAESRFQPTPHGGIASELPPLPPLARLGLGMMGEGEAAPVVGACECHSPFAQAGFVGGDRLVSVDGVKVRTVDEVRAALALARPKRAIEVVLLPALQFGGGVPVTKSVIVDFPAKWWLAKP